MSEYELYTGGFFWADELECLPDETPIKPYLEAMGFEVSFLYIGDLIDDLENYDRGGEYAADEIKKMQIVKRYPNGLKLMAVYDTEDGPFALYCNPVSGLALQHELQRQKIADMGQRIVRVETGLAAAIAEINGIVVGEWGQKNCCKWDDFMPGGRLLPVHKETR